MGDIVGATVLGDHVGNEVILCCTNEGDCVLIVVGAIVGTVFSGTSSGLTTPISPVLLLLNVVVVVACTTTS